jgi:hypothetical protein
MEVKLTPQESEEHFFNALCNGASYIESYGISIEPKEKDYLAAKQSLKDKKGQVHTMLCYEDVWMEILRMGRPLIMVDNEGGQEPKEVYLEDVHERVAKTEPRHLLNAINEEDDAETADVILQTVFYQEVIFG